MEPGWNCAGTPTLLWGCPHGVASAIAFGGTGRWDPGGRCLVVEGLCGWILESPLKELSRARKEMAAALWGGDQWVQTPHRQSLPGAMGRHNPSSVVLVPVTSSPGFLLQAAQETPQGNPGAGSGSGSVAGIRGHLAAAPWHDPRGVRAL